MRKSSIYREVVRRLQTLLSHRFELGTVALGSDADIVLFDPSGGKTISVRDSHSRVDCSLSEGCEFTGTVVAKVFSCGELIVGGAGWLGREGRGQFLKPGASRAA